MYLCIYVYVYIYDLITCAQVSPRSHLSDTFANGFWLFDERAAAAWGSFRIGLIGVICHSAQLPCCRPAAIAQKILKAHLKRQQIVTIQWLFQCAPFYARINTFCLATPRSVTRHPSPCHVAHLGQRVQFQQSQKIRQKLAFNCTSINQNAINEYDTIRFIFIFVFRRLLFQNLPHSFLSQSYAINFHLASVKKIYFPNLGNLRIIRAQTKFGVRLMVNSI